MLYFWYYIDFSTIVITLIYIYDYIKIMAIFEFKKLKPLIKAVGYAAVLNIAGRVAVAVISGAPAILDEALALLGFLMGLVEEE